MQEDFSVDRFRKVAAKGKDRVFFLSCLELLSRSTQLPNQSINLITYFGAENIDSLLTVSYSSAWYYALNL
jgi:hypothetical protein